MRPETKAGPIWRAFRELKVDSLMGSLDSGPPLPPRPAAGGSSCAKADRERQRRSENSLMDGSIPRGKPVARACLSAGGTLANERLVGNLMTWALTNNRRPPEPKRPRPVRRDVLRGTIREQGAPAPMPRR